MNSKTKLAIDVILSTNASNAIVKLTKLLKCGKLNSIKLVDAAKQELGVPFVVCSDACVTAISKLDRDAINYATNAINDAATRVAYQALSLSKKVN